MPCADRREAPQGPAGMAEALGARPVAQACDEALALGQTACGWTATGRRFRVEPGLSLPGHGVAPASDGTGRRVDVSGHGTDAPARCPQ